MRLVHLFITMLCIVVPSGKGTVLTYLANPYNLQHVADQNVGYSEAPRSDTSVASYDQRFSPKQNPNPTQDSQQTSKWLEPIVLLTGAYVVVTSFMLRAINKQGEQIERQIQISDNLGKWTAEEADSMRRQWRATHEQDLTLREQLTEMQQLARDTKMAAIAAQNNVGFLVSKERARLRVEFENVDPTPNSLFTAFMVRFKVILGGASQAEVKTFSCSCSAGTEDDLVPEAAWLIAAFFEDILRRFITPEDRRVPVERLTVVSQRYKDLSDVELSDALTTAKLHVFCRGRIVYEDIFGATWCRKFSKKWTYDTLAGRMAHIGQWLDYGDPEDNEEECVSTPDGYPVKDP